VHVWPRGSFVLVALPFSNQRFSGMLFLPTEGEPSFPMLREEQSSRTLVDRYFPELGKLLPELPSILSRSTARSLRRVRCFPWVHGGKIALLGDSAHSVLPFLGQGMGLALEDCRSLSWSLEQDGCFLSALTRYEVQRKPEADALDILALEHFDVLAGFAQSPRSVLQMNIEAELAKAYPEEFVPVYNLVAFTSLPLQVCLEIGRLQASLVCDLISSGGATARGIDFTAVRLHARFDEIRRRMGTIGAA
jgi:kynurenine 3-monooxygenase